MPARFGSALLAGVRRLAGDISGTASLEFALVAPLLFGLVFGIIEFGRIALMSTTLTFAAQEATRFAVVNAGNVSNEDIRLVAANALTLFNEQMAVFCVVAPPVPGTQTSEVRVTIAMDYAPLLPIPLAPTTLTGASEGFITFAQVQNGGVAVGTGCGAA